MAAADDDAWMGSPSARDPEFRLVDGLYRAPVAFEVYAASDPDPEERRPLYAAWRSLPEYPVLLEAVGSGDGARLKFAALEWTDKKLPFGPAVAKAGISIAGALKFVSIFVKEPELGWFTCPEARLDIFGRPRIWFWPPSRSREHASRLPPEVLDRWPAADERALVYCVGRLLLDATQVTRADLASPLGAVLRRCMMTDPARRYATLEELRLALRSAGGRRTIERTELEATIELGIGYLLREHWNDALAVCEEARELARFASPLLDHVRRYAVAHGATTPTVAFPRRPVGGVERLPPKRPWSELAETAQRLERDHDPRAALALYQQIAEDPPVRWRLFLALARCHLALGDTGYAIDYGRRALAEVSCSREAHVLIVKGLIARRDYVLALAAIEEWEKLLPDDASMHYARGKVLLGQHRFADALASFDKAIAKDGTMMEAMLLRREADRHARRSRAEVGTQVQPAVATELAALIGGEPVAAIETLQSERFVADPIAQLVLAQLLASEQRYSEALPVFVACTDHPEVAGRALCGAAAALIELDRAAEAFDLLGDASELEALELRVRALRQLGRTADADAEQAKLNTKVQTLSEIRVRDARAAPGKA